MKYEFILSPLTSIGLVQSTLPSRGVVAYACTNIQQVAEEECDVPHIDTWRHARVWVDFFGGVH